MSPPGPPTSPPMSPPGPPMSPPGPPTVSIAAGANAFEGGAAGTFTFTRTGNASQSLTVNYATAIGTGVATAGTDYVSPGSVTFAAGLATAVLSLPTIEDALVEGNEIISLNLYAGSGGGAYQINTMAAGATIQLIDNDSATVSIRKDGDVIEGNNGYFIVSRSGNITNSLTVNISAPFGTGSISSDYTLSNYSATLIFAVNQSEALLAVYTLEDSEIESVESVGIQVLAGTGYITSGSSVSLSIFDNSGSGDSPIAFGDYYSVSEDSVLTVGAVAGILSNDTQGGQGSASLTAILVSNTTYGMIALHPDGSFIYTPNVDHSGFDGFVYRVSNGTKYSAEAIVTIRVQRVPNDEVVALDDAVSTAPSTPVSFYVLQNDTDFANSGLTIAVDSLPAHGILTQSSVGTFSYSPTPGYSGEDSFKYTITNPIGKFDQATVYIDAKVEGARYVAIDTGAEYVKPPVGDDAGAGVWNSAGLIDTAYAAGKKVLIGKIVGSVVPFAAVDALAVAAVNLATPDAAAHMRHYLGNTGNDHEIDMESFLKVPSAKRLYESELTRVRQFAETLPIGVRKINANKVNEGGKDGAYIKKTEDSNWFYAIGGYSSWGRGVVTITDAGGGKKAYSLEFEYKVDDLYNWNKGQKVDIGPITVKDEILGQMHLAGVAKEYRNVGTYTQRIEWVK